MRELLIFLSRSTFHYQQNSTHQVIGFVLVHLGDRLMVLGSHGEATHVGVDVDGFQQTRNGLVRVHLENDKGEVSANPKTSFLCCEPF